MLCADGSVHWVQPLTAYSRQLQSKLPLADVTLTPDSAAMLQQWRADKCNPHTSPHFDAEARVPRTPHLQSHEIPAASVLLDVSVLCDASTHMDSDDVKSIQDFQAVVCCFLVL